MSLLLPSRMRNTTLLPSYLVRNEDRCTTGAITTTMQTTRQCNLLSAVLRIQMLPALFLPVELSGAALGNVISILHVAPMATPPVFLLLVDDGRGSNSGTGVYGTQMLALRAGGFSPVKNTLPRMNSAAYHPLCGIVYAAGKSLKSVVQEVWKEENLRRAPSVVFDCLLPAPGSRSGQDALTTTLQGKVAVVAVGSAFYAVAGRDAHDEEGTQEEPIKLLSFSQGSQVHPIIVLDVQDESLAPNWACIVVASGRECACVDIFYSGNGMSSSPPRNGTVTVASPILAAESSWPWVAVLTSDGLISVRSPSCLAIPLRTIEVGTRPNDFFILRKLEDQYIASISYSGEGKLLELQPDKPQDLADRLMRLAIDAFGANGFPRTELAEAVHASFTSTSYVGPEVTSHARSLLKQYLEAVLELADFESGASSVWPTEESAAAIKSNASGAFDNYADQKGSIQQLQVDASPTSIVCGTALLCLVCSQMAAPNAALCNRAAKVCCNKLGVVFVGASMTIAAVRVCESVAEKLLRQASQTFSLVKGSSPAPIASSHHKGFHMDFLEAAVWLLRSCGRHERAIEVLFERLSQNTDGTKWSQIKYESYTATHLSDLWTSGEEEGCRLVLHSPTTRRLLETNPNLGLSVFTASHPQNENQWKAMLARDDPLAHPTYPLQVVELLKSVNPPIPFEATLAYYDDCKEEIEVTFLNEGFASLPLDSGRALAVSYLESAVGISTGRPISEGAFDTLRKDEGFEERVISLHDELSYLLVEGIISERGDDDKDVDTPLGLLYRGKLRRLLRWPLAKVRSEKLLASLPSSFLQEHALLLGRLGRHEDALRILYCDLQSLDLALAYCDARHSRERAKGGGKSIISCAYLPLVRVALESDPDTERGTRAAIQVLALRSGSIDRAAALRLLPETVPVSAVARPFLIPALVDSESEIRRLKVVAALLRAKYVALKQKLTDAQIKSQSNLQGVAQLKQLNLGDPLHSTKPFKARPAHSASSTFPEVTIVKHFFLRHLVIQAKVTNSSATVDGRALGDVAFVVAESSDDAIQPLMQVPIKALPFHSTGSAWCVLSASPARMDGMALLTCELRYTVLAVDATTGAPLTFGGGAGRTYVEELQDLEAHAGHFS